MGYFKKLGIFLVSPEKGASMSPPLPQRSGTGDLGRAFQTDLFQRLQKLKKLSVTVFHAGADPGDIDDRLPKGWTLAARLGNTPGEQLRHAFDVLLEEEGSCAVLIRSDSPDIPLLSVKRAYNKLKHKDLVLGPSANGGCYLLGLKKQIPEMFEDIPRGNNIELRHVLEFAAAHNMSLSLLPLWYTVDAAQPLELFETMMLARRVEGSGRLPCTEALLLKLYEDRANR